MKTPTIKKPVANMKDKELLNNSIQIRRYFDDYSSGDPYGWDFPTMNLLFPELTARLREIHVEINKRMDATGGKFNGDQYTNTEKGWKHNGKSSMD